MRTVCTNAQRACSPYLHGYMSSHKSVFLFALFYLTVIIGAELTSASEFGRNGFSANPSTNGGATCNVCHVLGASVPNVTISGPVVVDAGTRNSYTVTIRNGPARTGGINISTSDFAGELIPADSDLKLIGRELSHISPKLFASDELSFSFFWTAPTYNGDVTIFAAGNSSNGQRDLAGDGIDTNTLKLTVQNGSQPPPTPPPTPAVNIALDEIASGLVAPVVITHAGDQRLFIVERPGRIRIVNANGNLVGTPFLNIETRVDDDATEQGLLGLAFHPDYDVNEFFYVYYTWNPGAGADRSRIARFQASADRDVADPGSELVIMEFEQPFSNHNAGDLHFGPDLYLYIASGDGGGSGDPQNRAQNKSSLLGKLLRIDVDTPPDSDNGPDCDLSGNSNYRIPPSNAFNDGTGGAGCDEIYALGLRNPWRFSFDRWSGDLWIADVGQGNYEEINRVLAGAGGGLNFGWRCYEGGHAFNIVGCQDQYFFPDHEYSRAAGDCSVTGGIVYRGIDYPALNGHYFFTDFCNATIRTLSDTGSGLALAEVLPAGMISAPSAFGEDLNGELYVASLNSGRVYKIRDLGSGSPPTALYPGDQLKARAALPR